jgi:hypothetical protein
LLPQAEVVLIPGSKHLVPLPEPDALGEALAKFARRHPIGRVASADDATRTTWPQIKSAINSLLDGRLPSLAVTGFPARSWYAGTTG